MDGCMNSPLGRNVTFCSSRYRVSQIMQIIIVVVVAAAAAAAIIIIIINNMENWKTPTSSFQWQSSLPAHGTTWPLSWSKRSANEPLLSRRSL